MAVPSLFNQDKAPADPDGGQASHAKAQASHDKAQLRSEWRERRRAFAAALPPAAREALELRLADALAPLLRGAGTIAGYRPMAGEIGPLAALDRAAAAGATIAWPGFAARDSAMDFRCGTPLEPGPWGPPQPPATAPAVTPDLVLVPLIAVDRAGNRLGQGQGHYDRVLGPLRFAGARLVGLGWSFQLIGEPIPHDPWDVALDMFASPDGLVELGQ